MLRIQTPGFAPEVVTAPSTTSNVFHRGVAQYAPGLVNRAVFSSGHRRLFPLVPIYLVGSRGSSSAIPSKA